MPRSKSTFDIIIVGAGLGGLSTAVALSQDGYKIQVLDAVEEFQEVLPMIQLVNTYTELQTLTSVQAGAGIRLPPNSSRLLIRWGVDMDKIKKTIVERYHFIRWRDGSTIVDLPSFDNCEKTYGAPYYLIHRADLHAGLLETAQRLGVTVLKGKKVIGYDFDKPSVRTEDGMTYSADLIIAAEGKRNVPHEIKMHIKRSIQVSNH